MKDRAEVLRFCSIVLITNGGRYMNFRIGDITFVQKLQSRIRWKREEKADKRRMHQTRLAKQLSDIRYLDHVVITEGSQYFIGNKKFSSLNEALVFCRKTPIDKLAKYLAKHQAGRKQTICITIKNTHAPEFFQNEWIPKGLIRKDTKDVLCLYARERQINIATDLSEVYTEYFELCKDEGMSYECIYDYGILYGNYPVYNGTELCLSKLTEDWDESNSPFVPESRKKGLENPCEIFDRLQEVYMAYDCYFIRFTRDGSIYDDDNGRFPFDAIPVSTFVNIGKAGVYWDCWKQIWGNLEDIYARYEFAAEDSEEHDLFRFALMTCKEQEIPQGRAYYTIHIKDSEADGMIPSDFVPCTYAESREKLFVHAQHRTVYISPSFDGVYGEEFDLLNAKGEKVHFRYDYALLSPNAPQIQAGKQFRTCYWSNVGFCNPLTDETVSVTSITDPKAIYDGKTDVNLCCTCELSHEAIRTEILPVSTLILVNSSLDDKSCPCTSV